MAEAPDRGSRRVLEPIERISEVLFGLIMVLTFTCSLSVAEVGRDDVRTMLVAALGCNLAWGIIDAVFYLMGSLAEKGRGLTLYREIRRAEDPAVAGRLVAGALPPVVAAVLGSAEVDTIRRRLVGLPEPPARARLDRDDGLGALAVFLWVFVSTFPVAIPFLLLDDAARALRLSNAVAVILLFATGYVFGRVAGRSPWGAGLVMVVLGVAMVALTIALGG